MTDANCKCSRNIVDELITLTHRNHSRNALFFQYVLYSKKTKFFRNNNKTKINLNCINQTDFYIQYQHHFIFILLSPHK